MRTRSFVHAVVAVAVSAGLLLWAAWWFGAPKVGEKEREEIHGGQTGNNGWCIQTNTTCPDPGGIPTTCTYMPSMKLCVQCKMNVPNWSSCVMKNANYNCTESIAPTNPYCGDVYIGTPTGSTCGNGCSAYNKLSCGNQIPTINMGSLPCNP